MFVSTPFGQLNAEEKGKLMTVKKITPILFAEEIEPCLKFWMERLGFEKTIDVPEEPSSRSRSCKKVGSS